MNAKLDLFVQNLLTGTRAGALKWEKTPEAGVYRLMLDKGLVRIYRLGPMTVGENFVGCTVLDGTGNVINDEQVSQMVGGHLIQLYDFVDGTFQEGALDDLLAEVKRRTEGGGLRAPAGQR
jgi:hypothetical protein